MKSWAKAFCAGLGDLIVGGQGNAVADVFADAGGKDDRFLGDDADLPAQRIEGSAAEVDAVDQDASLGGIVKAREQGEEGGLARAVAADDGDALALGDG